MKPDQNDDQEAWTEEELAQAEYVRVMRNLERESNQKAKALSCSAPSPRVSKNKQIESQIIDDVLTDDKP